MEVEEIFSQLPETPPPLHSLGHVFLTQGGRRGALPQGARLLTALFSLYEKEMSTIKNIAIQSICLYMLVSLELMSSASQSTKVSNRKMTNIEVNVLVF